MPSSAAPLIETHRPATFRSRGVAVPFTTPLLAAARVRESRRTGIELVVPNASGGRGIYVLMWPGVRELCAPTLHDWMLIQRISHLPGIDPATVREAALAVALDGYAGREAAAAAAASRATGQAQRLLAQFLLLAQLIEQVEPAEQKAAVLADRTPEFDRRARLILPRIARSFGCPVADLTAGVVALANAFVPVGVGFGVGPGERTARLPRLLARLEDALDGLALWLATDPGNDIGGLGRAVAAAMKGTFDSAEALLGDARKALAEPANLLKRWIADPDEAVAPASRCDWLLDGWERICLLWAMAHDQASRRAVLLEMAQLLPALPSEVTNWLRFAIPPDAMDPACRVTSRIDTWRSGGAAFALIRRNETLRAMSM